MSPRSFAGLTLLALAVGGASAALAQAQVPASSTVTGGTPSPQATPAASPATPASTTASAGAQPAAALAVADPPPAAPRKTPGAAGATAPPTASATATPGSAGSDRIELGTTEISGNRELPKLMYIVPWKRAEVGKITGRPPNSLVDEVLTPVDRTVFERQNSYYAALQAASASDASQPAARGAPPAAAAPRDEK